MPTPSFAASVQASDTRALKALTRGVRRGAIASFVLAAGGFGTAVYALLAFRDSGWTVAGVLLAVLGLIGNEVTRRKLSLARYIITHPEEIIAVHGSQPSPAGGFHRSDLAIVVRQVAAKPNMPA